MSKITRKHVNEIMEHFNFKKAHRAMVALNWTYAGSDGVPSIHELKKVARHHLEELVNNDEYIASESGGFRAARINGEYGEQIKLSFIITHWESAQ